MKEILENKKHGTKIELNELNHFGVWEEA